MDELLEYIVKNLVSKPEEVKIEQVREDGVVNFNLTVAADDMGLIIGKAGQTIRAIRRLLVARAMAEGNIRVNLNLQEIS
ncbi:KH domain-containing protein [Candidatus Daviesbacteria bacterium]|nr:KH domain-containing protein [Candidatus Daviesbacteria bacterium]